MDDNVNGFKHIEAGHYATLQQVLLAIPALIGVQLAAARHEPEDGAKGELLGDMAGLAVQAAVATGDKGPADVRLEADVEVVADADSVVEVDELELVELVDHDVERVDVGVGEVNGFEGGDGAGELQHPAGVGPGHAVEAQPIGQGDFKELHEGNVGPVEEEGSNILAVEHIDALGQQLLAQEARVPLAKGHLDGDAFGYIQHH